MGEGFAVVVALPPLLAREFPPVAEGGVGSRPHVTILYFRPQGAQAIEAARRIVRSVAGLTDAIPVEITGGLHYFAPSQASEGRSLAVAAVQSEGLLRLRERVLAALAQAGVRADQTHPGFVPHVTLAYLPPGETWKAPVPAGRFLAEEIEIWVASSIERLQLDAPGFGQTISAAPALPRSLGPGGL